MQAFIQFWNGLMAAGVFIGIAIILGFIYTLALPMDGFSRAVSAFVRKHANLLGFLIALAAMVSSLVYSDYIGYPPCLLCWYARTLFYPQVFMFGLALKKRDRSIWDYSLFLSVLGMVLTCYHFLTDMFQYSPLPCTVNGVSCLTRYVYMFGFITIPFMGFIGFTMLFLTILVAKKATKNVVA